MNRGGPCRGLVGIVLGHKFVRGDGHASAHCLRCGMPAGGWGGTGQWLRFTGDPS